MKTLRDIICGAIVIVGLLAAFVWAVESGFSKGLVSFSCNRVTVCGKVTIWRQRTREQD